MARCYFAVFMPAVEGGHVVAFPDFPEAFTQGDTLDECLLMGADALSITVEEYAKARKFLPEPSSLEKIREWAEKERNSEGLLPDGEVLYQLFIAPEADMTPVRVTVSIAKSVLDSIDEKARISGLTRSGFLVTAAQAYSPR